MALLDAVLLLAPIAAQTPAYDDYVRMPGAWWIHPWTERSEGAPHPQVVEHVLEGRAVTEAVEGTPWSQVERAWHLVEEPIGTAFATLELEQDEILFVALHGARVVYVNGLPCAGDPQRRGGYGVPVQFRAGENTLLVRDAPDGFTLSAWRPQNRIVVDTWSPPAFSLDADAKGWGPFMDVPVQIWNASLEPIQNLHFYYGDWSVPGRRPSNPREEVRAGGSVLPLCGVTRYAWPMPTRGVIRDCTSIGSALAPVSVCTKSMLIEIYLPYPVEAEAREFSPGHEMMSAPKPFSFDPVQPAWSLLRPTGGSGFHGRPLVVYGTRGEADAHAAHARLVQQQLAIAHRPIPEAIADVDVKARPDGSYVVIGNADSVHGWDMLVQKELGLRATDDELVRGEDVEIRGRTAALQLAVDRPLGPDDGTHPLGRGPRPFVVITHTGEHGARLAWQLSLHGGDERGVVTVDGE
ncbi:MAG: hypothetical protein AAGA20_08040 [Planctomycetota bacterium]